MICLFRNVNHPNVDILDKLGTMSRMSTFRGYAISYIYTTNITIIITMFTTYLADLKGRKSWTPGQLCLAVHDEKC